MKEIVLYVLISVSTVVVEKLLDKWVKHSKSTKNRLDDLVSAILYDAFTKIKSSINFKMKKNG